MQTVENDYFLPLNTYWEIEHNRVILHTLQGCNMYSHSPCSAWRCALTLLCVAGLDSTFGGLEAMITALCDEYPRLLGRHRELFVCALLVFVYICSLPTTTYVSSPCTQKQILSWTTWTLRITYLLPYTLFYYWGHEEFTTRKCQYTLALPCLPTEFTDRVYRPS